jgi:hypothetical protein
MPTKLPNAPTENSLQRALQDPSRRSVGTADCIMAQEQPRDQECNIKLLSLRHTGYPKCIVDRNRPSVRLISSPPFNDGFCATGAPRS